MNTFSSIDALNFNLHFIVLGLTTYFDSYILNNISLTSIIIASNCNIKIDQLPKQNSLVLGSTLLKVIWAPFLN